MPYTILANISSNFEPPESPPPEPEQRSNVSNKRLLSPISFVISAFEWKPKT